MSLLTPGIFVVRNAFLLRIFVVDVVNNYILATNLRVFHKSLNVAVTGYRAAVKNVSPSRRARACPSPCIDRGGQAPALRLNRMPPAPASGFPSPCCARGGQAPALRLKNGPLPRRARACPSPCCDCGASAFASGEMWLIRPVLRHAVITGDRPPRYG